MRPVRKLGASCPISLAEALRMLCDQTPAFKPYAGFDIGDKQPYGLLVWRDKKLLTLEDMLMPEDDLEMIVMVAGG